MIPLLPIARHCSGNLQQHVDEGYVPCGDTDAEVPLKQAGSIQHVRRGVAMRGAAVARYEPRRIFQHLGSQPSAQFAIDTLQVLAAAPVVSAGLLPGLRHKLTLLLPKVGGQRQRHSRAAP